MATVPVTQFVEALRLMKCIEIPNDVRPLVARKTEDQKNAEMVARWGHLAIHRGRRPETAGQILSRVVFKTPSPLPAQFVERLAVSVASDPDLFGRILAPAVRAATERRIDGHLRPVN